jgi:putative membrane-bound dehydrogenase-like protein
METIVQPSHRNWLFNAFLIASCTSLSTSSADDFPTPLNSEKSTTTPMVPADVVKSAKLPAGFELSVFAAEPNVQNPIAMTTDERGRLWVAENYSWAGGGAGGFDGNQRDRIVVLEDTDGDGKHDKRTVFWDNARKLTSIEVGNGGVWAIALPNVLFFPDANRDDVPDSAPKIVLDGLDEGVVGHTPANGLKWGPDGWLYARHGIQATSNIGKPGAGDSQRIKINTGVWRFHPVDGTVETVMHGMTNSWGFDFDQHGEMFVINTVIGHLWHVVPGAHVERMYGVDLNPNTYQLIAQTADHVHWDNGEKWNTVQKGMSDGTNAAGGGHAHIGLMIYQGDNWPVEYRNRLFTLNLHGSRINSNLLERQGAGYVGKRAPDFCLMSDPWFRGMDLITGPDGGVFIADWSDTGECHDHDGVHRTSGRIYKLTSGKPSPIHSLDLAKQTDSQLIALQLHENAWWPRTARRILAERYATGKTPMQIADLRKEIDKTLENTKDVAKRLRLIETCYSVGAADESWLISHLSATDEHERVAAIRFLVDRVTPNGKPLGYSGTWLSDKARKDPSGLVDLYLASALQRLSISDRWVIARELVTKSVLSQDRMFPNMLWYGIEPAVGQEPNQAIALLKLSSIPMVTENIARRITLDIDSRPEIVSQMLLEAQKLSFPLADQVAIGMAKALNGWQKAKPPSGWSNFANRFAKSESKEVIGAMQSLRLVFGDGRAVVEMIKLAEDGNADAEARRQALRSLLSSRPADLTAILFKLLGDRAMVREAIRGLAQFEHPDAPKQILNRSRGFNPAERGEMINTLASRPSYAKALLSAVRDKTVAASEISAFHARQIRSFDDDALNQELSETWGDVRGTAEDKRKLMDQLRGDLSAEAIEKSDLRAGRALFQKTCASCHVLYGAGIKIGPDLTGSNRKNIDYLLENIVDPSASVGADFRALIVLLKDGRVVTGVTTATTDRTLTLQTATEPVTLDRSEIESTKQSKTSLMPDGLLQNLNAEQIRNLIGYLMSTDQVALPE